MIRLDSFRTEARGVRGNSRIALRDGATRVSAQTGRVARWIGRFRKSENREATDSFITSLRQRYGREIADHLVRSTGMDRAMARGKPLRARHVTEVVDQANLLRADVVNRNAEVTQHYLGQRAIGSNRSLLQNRLEQLARQEFPARPDIHLRIDAERLAGIVQGEIDAAGDNGTHLVTTGEADEILTSVVTREFAAAREALRKTSFEEPNSISRQLLSQALDAGREPPLNINPARFEADLIEAMQSKLEHAIFHRPETLERNNETALHALARELVEDFVEERAAVRDAVDDLLLDTESKGRILDQALHDNIRPDMVPAMGWAYLQVRHDLPTLGKHLGPMALHEPLSLVCGELVDAIRESNVEAGAEIPDAVCRTFWRFLLAPGGQAQASAVADRMTSEGGALRSVAQGAAWFAHEFPQTDGGSRTVVDKHGRERLKHGESIRTASRYSVMMESLARVLRDRTDAPAGEFGLSARGGRLLPREFMSDETIATLRNLGIAVPAPNRLGESNPDAPISQPALEAMRAEIDDHLESVAQKPVINGIVAECLSDLARCRFRIDDQLLPRDADIVAQGLRDFCTDRNGNLNEEMLLGISKIAYQVAFAPAWVALLHPLHSDTSLVSHMPGVPTALASVNYSLSRNANGAPALRAEFTGRCNSATSMTDTNVESVSLDTETSHIDISLDYTFDPNDFRPSIEGTKIGYALFEAFDPPDADSDPQAT